MKKYLYSKKAVEWDSDMRTMLAETIGKPVPERDEKLTTRIKKPTAKNSKSKISQSKSSQSSGSSNSGDIRFGVSGKRANLEELGGFASAFSSYKPHGERKTIKNAAFHADEIEVKQERHHLPKSPTKKIKTENNRIK
jgi:hypothetical protein